MKTTKVCITTDKHLRKSTKHRKLPTLPKQQIPKQTHKTTGNTKEYKIHQNTQTKLKHNKLKPPHKTARYQIPKPTKTNYNTSPETKIKYH